jgi:hypothetical protein
MVWLCNQIRLARQRLVTKPRSFYGAPDSRAGRPKVIGNEEDLDDVRRLVLSRGRALGLNLTTMSRAVGRSAGYMHQFIWRGVPAKLLEAERHRLAATLGINEVELRGPEPLLELATPPGIETGLLQREPVMHGSIGGAVASRINGRDIPVHNDSGPLERGPMQAYVARPHPSIAPAETYAIWISANRGRLRPGDLAYIDRVRPPRAGDMVAVTRDRSIVAVGELTALSNVAATVRVDVGDVYKVDRSTEVLEKIRWVELG